MKVLHVTGDWKWTGPAEPMLRLLLAQREAGDEADLACPEAEPGSGAGLLERARRAGVEPLCALSRGRGVRWLADARDAARLRRLVAERGFDVLHAWHTRGHALAWRAAPRRRRAGAPRLVRSWSRAERIPRWPWNRLLFGAGCDGLLCVSQASARSNAGLCPGRPVRGALGAVEVERFAPAPAPAAVRGGLGLAPEHRVVGIVARVQRHRRFDLLLEAARRWLTSDPRGRLLVVGRGTHLDAVARRPAERLGIADRVIFAGHRETDYADVLRSLDVFTLLVPGSDGSCRAVLEAAACGLPAVTTRRGALPEIVLDGRTGLTVDERPEALCAAWRRLLDDPALRRRLGRQARERAEREFRPARLAADVAALYREARGGAPGPPAPQVEAESWSCTSSR